MTATPAQRRRRIGWGIGVALAGAIIGMIIGWIVALQLEGERDAATRNAQEQKVTATAALGYMRSECAAGDPVACDYVDRITDLPDLPVTGDETTLVPIPGQPGQPGRKGDRGPSCIEEIGYPRCRGDKGTAGTAGAGGTDGSVGASCVAELGLEACRGDKGDKGDRGDAGTDGKDGRGVQSLTCEGGQVVVAYTDGTTQPVDGWSCLPPAPNPDNPGGPQ